MPITVNQIKDAFTNIKGSNQTNKEMMAQYVNDVQAIFNSNPDSSQVAFKTTIENHLYQLSNIGVKSPNKKKSSIQNKKKQLMTEHFPNLMKELSDLSKVSADTHQDQQIQSNILYNFLQSENGKEISNLLIDDPLEEEDKQYLYTFITDNADLFEKKLSLQPSVFEERLRSFFVPTIDDIKTWHSPKYENLPKSKFKTIFIETAEILYKNEKNIDLYRVELLCVLAYFNFLGPIDPELLEQVSLYKVLTHNEGVQEILMLEKKISNSISLFSGHGYNFDTFFEYNAMRTGRLCTALLIGIAYFISAPIQMSILAVTTFLLIINLYEQIQLNKFFFSHLRKYAGKSINSDNMPIKTSYNHILFNVFITSVFLMAPSLLVISMIANPTFLQLILIGFINTELLIMNHRFSLNNYKNSYENQYLPLVKEHHTKDISQARSEINTLKLNYQQRYFPDTCTNSDNQLSKDSASSSDSSPQTPKETKTGPYSTEQSLFGASNTPVATTGSDSTNRPNK